MRGSAPWLAALLALTAAAYAASVGGAFVWDDVILIRDNPRLATLDGALAAAGGDFFQQAAASDPLSGYRRPVPTLLNALTLAAAGPTPWVFRLTNLLLHLGAVALAFGLLRRLGVGPRAALVGAGVFALHPAQTEAVAFVSGRTDLLAAVFGLLAVHGHLTARRRGSARWAAGAALALGAAIASKEVALVVPAALAVLEARGLVAPGGARRRLLFGLYGALLAGWLALRLGAPAPGRLYFEAADTPVAALGLVALYARILAAPLSLRALHDHTPVAEPGAATALGALVVLLVLAAALQRRDALLGAGAAWAGGFLLPALHLLAPLPTLAAERYLYLPLLGLGIAAAALVTRLPRLAPVAAAGLLAAAALTADRALDWRDEITLWSAEVQRPTPGFKPWQNLAVALAEQGHAAEALAAIHEAWRARPGHPLVFRNLVRISLAARPLPPATQRELVAVALARRPDPAALARWPGPLRAAGHGPLADAVEAMVAASR